MTKMLEKIELFKKWSADQTHTIIAYEKYCCYTL